MPFVRLVNSHRCEPPKQRDDLRPLVIGDEWRCDEKRDDESGKTCGKIFRWSFDQREGNYWKPLSS
jgi:hypothetical protein